MSTVCGKCNRAGAERCSRSSGTRAVSELHGAVHWGCSVDGVCAQCEARDVLNSSLKAPAGPLKSGTKISDTHEFYFGAENAFVFRAGSRLHRLGVGRSRFCTCFEVLKVVNGEIVRKPENRESKRRATCMGGIELYGLGYCQSPKCSGRHEDRRVACFENLATLEGRETLMRKVRRVGSVRCGVLCCAVMGVSGRATEVAQHQLHGGCRALCASLTLLRIRDVGT